ncbi:putative ergosterol biosynthetic protein 28, partial [Galemys pyrenaicus]
PAHGRRRRLLPGYYNNQQATARWEPLRRRPPPALTTLGFGRGLMSSRPRSAGAEPSSQKKWFFPTLFPPLLKGWLRTRNSSPTLNRRVHRVSGVQSEAWAVATVDWQYWDARLISCSRKRRTANQSEDWLKPPNPGGPGRGHGSGELQSGPACLKMLFGSSGCSAGHLTGQFPRQKSIPGLREAMSHFQKVLRSWLFMVSIITMGSSLQCFQDHTFLYEKLYTVRPDLVNGLYARIFGVWTLLSSVVRCLCAINIHNKPLYYITIWTFVIALGHFLSELFIYKTVTLTNGILALLFVASFSTLGMLAGLRYLEEEPVPRKKRN